MPVVGMMNFDDFNSFSLKKSFRLPVKENHGKNLGFELPLGFLWQGLILTRVKIAVPTRIFFFHLVQ